MPNLSVPQETVLFYIRCNPGSTAKDIAAALRQEFRGDEIYGAHRNVSSVIAGLRKAKLITDCPRCPSCDRALSRGQRNVPLYPLFGEANA